MNKLFSFILGLSILVYLGYVVIESILILIGKSDRSWADMQQFYLGAAMIVLIVWYSFRQNKRLGASEEMESANSSDSTSPAETKPKERILRLIITASEATCSRINEEFRNHPWVFSCFEDTGNWYSNGETGPEWFTVTLETTEELKDRLEAALDEWLKANELNVSNMYWG